MIRHSVLYFIILNLLACTVAFADDPEKVEKVVVTGIGINAEKAQQNAIRNAVEQVVGSFISSETMVKNSMLLKDEILSFSGGYVKESRVLSTEKEDDLIKVRLEALVIATKLKRKIDALNIAVIKVDGGSLFAEAISKAEASRTAGQQLLKVLSKFPHAAYRITLQKPEITSVDHSKETAKVKFTANITWDTDFIAELKEVIKHLAYAHNEYESLPSSPYNNFAGLRNKEDTLVIMLSKIGSFNSGKSEESFLLDLGKSTICDEKNVIPQLSGQYVARNTVPRMVLQLVNKSKEVVDSIEISLSSISAGNINNQMPDKGNPFIRVFDNAIYYQPFDILLLTDASADFQFIHEISTAKLGEVESMKAYIPAYRF